MTAEVGGLMLPGDLLHAVASRSGSVTLVVGAGCSLDPPTGLKLSRDYASEAYDDLVADHVLMEGDCSDPSDLSCVATAVMERHGVQAPLAKRLPLPEFKFAKANEGYLLAAALMAEDAIAYVATLNYDMALSDAVTQIQPDGVREVAGPEGLWDYGDKAIIYLHRSAREPDLEKLVLRKEAIESDWAHGWEGVVAARLVAAPVVVFAGLGSPAGALSETLRRVRAHVPDATTAFVVDPAPVSAFSEALNLDPDNHIQTGWGPFMTELAERVVHQFAVDLKRDCVTFATEHNCPGLDALDQVIAGLASLGLLGLGRARSHWLGSSRMYTPDIAAHRPHVADLSLGVASLVDDSVHSIDVHPSGVVTLSSDEGRALTVYLTSGLGQHRWASLEPVLASCRTEIVPAPDIVLAAAYRGTQLDDLVPPGDIMGDTADHDVAHPTARPVVINLDDLRDDPGLLEAAGF